MKGFSEQTPDEWDIEAQEKEKPMGEWISVKDRLPELIAQVIWYYEHGNTIVGTYTKLGWTFSYYPELPKGES